MIVGAETLNNKETMTRRMSDQISNIDPISSLKKKRYP